MDVVQQGPISPYIKIMKLIARKEEEFGAK
jgi:hypothetical protein